MTEDEEENPDGYCCNSRKDCQKRRAVLEDTPGGSGVVDMGDAEDPPDLDDRIEFYISFHQKLRQLIEPNARKSDAPEEDMSFDERTVHNYLR